MPRQDILPGNPEQFNSAVPFLVEAAIKRPNKSKVERRMLLEGLEKSDSLNPGINALAVSTSIVWDDLKRTGANVRTGIELMNLMGYRMFSGTKDGQGKTVDVTPKTQDQMRQISSPKFAQNAYFMRVSNQVVETQELTRDMMEFAAYNMDQLNMEMRRASEDGRSSLVYTPRIIDGRFLEGSTDPSRQSVEKLRVIAQDPQNNLRKLVEFTKQESFGGIDTIFNLRIEGASLEDISQMSYPLSKDDTKRVTDYFSGILKMGDSIETAHIIGIMLTSFPAIFDGGKEGKRESDSTDVLLANLASWQENFAYAIVYPGDEMSDHFASLFKRFPVQLKRIPEQIAYWALEPQLSHPNFDGKLEGIVDSHPFLKKAKEEFLKQRSLIEWEYFSYPDSFLFKFTYEKVLPQALISLRGLKPDVSQKEINEHKSFIVNFFKNESVDRPHVPGFAARLSHGLSNLEKKVYEGIMSVLDQEHKFDEKTRDSLPQAFSRDKKRKLAEHSEEMEMRASNIIVGISEAGVNHLPLEDGVDIIEFSKESILAGFHLESIIINRAPSGDIRFRLNLDLKDARRGQCVFIGVVSGSNMTIDTLGLRGPIFHFMSLVAASSIKDLCVREEKRSIMRSIKEKNEKKEKSTGVKSPRDPHGDNDKAVLSVPRPPYVRRQTDINLQDEIRPRRDPTRIGIHGMTLAGIDTYRSALANYLSLKRGADRYARNNDVVNWEAAEELLVEVIPQLQEARKSTRKISAEKKTNWPVNLKRKFTTDPATNDEMYSRTWVVEHTTPKLTEEEEHEIVLWQRHYKPGKGKDEVVTALGRLSLDFADLL